MITNAVSSTSSASSTATSKARRLRLRAKNALADGIESRQVAQMLMDNNSDYRELATKSSESQAQLMIVNKAQAELAVQNNERSDDGRSRRTERGRGRSQSEFLSQDRAVRLIRRRIPFAS